MKKNEWKKRTKKELYDECQEQLHRRIEAEKELFRLRREVLSDLLPLMTIRSGQNKEGR